jgi:uncharacterized protein (TIGR02996 family)
MTITDDIAALQRALDVNPADWDTRLVLADCLAEQAGGECPGSRCQRWMVRRKVYPVARPRLERPFNCYWMTAWDHAPKPSLPAEVFSRLVGGDPDTGGSSWQQRDYPNRAEAEADLAQALDQFRREYACD